MFKLKCVISIVTIIFIGVICYNFKKRPNENDRFATDTLKTYDNYKHHNYINPNIKMILLSYLKGHPEDVSTDLKIQGVSFADQSEYMYLTSKSPLSYVSLNTTDTFNVPEKADAIRYKNEFDYKKFLQSVIDDGSNSKRIVTQEIEKAPVTVESSIEFSAELSDYNFNLKKFPVSTFDFTESKVLNIFSGFCKLNIISQNNPMNGSYDGQTYSGNNNLINIDYFKKNAFYYIGDDNDYSYDGEYRVVPGLLSFPLSRCSENMNRYYEHVMYPVSSKSNCTKELHFNVEINKYQSNIIAGSYLPSIYLDLTDLFLITDYIRKNGIEVKNENQAREISNTHEIIGTLVVSFAPADDCYLKDVCETVRNPFKMSSDCSKTKVMICAPHFHNLAWQILPLNPSDKASKN